MAGSEVPTHPLRQLLDLLCVDNDERLCVATLSQRGRFTRSAISIRALRRLTRSSDEDHYIGMVVLDDSGQVKAKNARRCPGLWADIDVKSNGMPTWESAEAVVAELARLLSSEPVFVIESGHGLQPVWLLEEVDSWDVKRIATTLKRFGNLVHLVARTHEGAADSVFDLARVLRMPGTINHKVPEEPVETDLRVTGGRPLSLDQIEEVLDAFDVPTEPAAKGNLDRPSADWSWAAETCAYVRSMVTAWTSDEPSAGRHMWSFAQQIRLTAAWRRGCITQEAYDQALDALQARMDVLRAPDGQRPNEVAQDTKYAIAKVEAKTDDACRSELGDHDHSATSDRQEGDYGLDLAEGQYKSVPLGRRMAKDWAGRFIFVTSIGWHRWDGCRWERVPLEHVMAAAAGWIDNLLHALVKDRADLPTMNAVLPYRDTGVLRRLVDGAKTAPAALVSPSQLDSHPHLLNCPNGVVDLRTGELKPSDPALLMTKVSGVDYVPSFTHPDWNRALQALKPEEQRHLQIRLGQAAYAEPTPRDDVLICRGGGSNGKTTVMTTVLLAVGDYGITVQDRAIMANPHDHPTEMMVFRGARLALLEETPERGRLDVNKLKKVAGTPRLSGRYISKDVIEWNATHTLIINTNYDPLVEETDHGVWRRLTMLPFDRTYRPGVDLDTTLRPRLLAAGSDGMKAALAWVVAGAVAYHHGDRVIPEPTGRMRAATKAWRNDNDHLGAFIDEYLIIEGPTSRHAILSTDLVATFGDWMKRRGHQAWSENTIAQRMKGHHLLEGHGVVKRVKRTAKLNVSVRPMDFGPLRPQATVWLGLRWNPEADLL